ncbi:MAG: hypothetical protein Q9200_006992, partial [Gallowayella weberi]
MAPYKKTKEKTPGDVSTGPRPLTRRRSGRPGSTQPISPTSITDRLLAARSFLHSEDPSTYPDFLAQYQQIQTFFNDLSSAKELFDIAVYKDIEAILRVHGDRLMEPLNLQRRRSSTSSLTNPSPSPPKVFSSDLAYDRSSTATTTRGSPDPSKPILSTSEQGFEHHWQEGDTLTFSPNIFGSVGGPRYSYPAPKMVMGFDPEKGFVTRNLNESEKEKFPGSGNGQGFARLNHPSRKDGPGVRKQDKQPPTKGKETFQKPATLTSAIKKTTPGPSSSSVRTKRAHFEEDTESPNKRPKPQSLNPMDDYPPNHDNLHNHISEDDDPAYNTDDLTASGPHNHQPRTADDDSEDELSKPADQKGGDDFAT